MSTVTSQSPELQETSVGPLAAAQSEWGRAALARGRSLGSGDKAESRQHYSTLSLVKAVARSQANPLSPLLALRWTPAQEV